MRNITRTNLDVSVWGFLTKHALEDRNFIEALFQGRSPFQAHTYTLKRSIFPTTHIHTQLFYIFQIKDVEINKYIIIIKKC